MNKLELQKKIFIICFLVIPVTLLIAFVAYPAVYLFVNSLFDWNGISDIKKFIGTANYKEVFFNSPDLWLSLKNNAIYFFIHLIFIPLELIVAVILNSKIKGSKFFKSVAFMPYIINGVAVAYAFSFFYSPVNGALNEILKALGLGGLVQNWLSNIHIVNFSLVFISLWRYSGFHIILFIAALQSIPADIIEASIVDGANAVQRFMNIIVPSIKTVVELILFLNLRGALQVFDIPFVVTQGGPGHASSTFTLYTIETAFKFNNFGLASSMGVTLLFMIIILNWVQKKVFSLGGDE